MLQRIDYRKVLEDDKAGKMKVEVQQVLTIPTIYSLTAQQYNVYASHFGSTRMSHSQVGQWKFLGFSGEFSTTLYVKQDKKAGKASIATLHA